MKDIGEMIGAIFLVGFLTLIIWLMVIGERDANEQCRKMLGQAKNNTDTLIVYGMKPHSKLTTCADRLSYER